MVTHKMNRKEIEGFIGMKKDIEHIKEGMIRHSAKIDDVIKELRDYSKNMSEIIATKADAKRVEKLEKECNEYRIKVTVAYASLSILVFLLVFFKDQIIKLIFHS